MALSMMRQTRKSITVGPGACVRCKYFYPSAEKGRGECRQSSPTIIRDNQVRVFPVVYNEDWCGNFEPNPTIYNTGEETPLQEG